MNTLSYPAWPDDMTDERWVIAVLRMMQIMEDDVDNLSDMPVVTVEQITRFRNAALKIESDKDAEIERLTAESNERAFLLVQESSKVCELTEETERLNGLVAMQHKALMSLTEEFRTGAGGSRNFSMSMRKEIITNALSASSDTVSAYKREVQADALEKAIDKAVTIRRSYGGAGARFAESMLIEMASELRAKGEQT